MIDNLQNQGILDELNHERNKLNEIMEDKTKGIILRSKAEWVEGSEKNTKQFSNLRTHNSIMRIFIVKAITQKQIIAIF